MIMNYIESYFTAVGLKCALRLEFLFGGEAIMEMYIRQVNVVTQKYCCHMVALIVRSAIKLDNE